jgi:hypothetical protein
MGSVAMEEIDLPPIPRVYMNTQTAYCIYCDKCGSFNVRRRTALKIAVWIPTLALIATVLLWSIKLDVFHVLVLTFIISLLILGISNHVSKLEYKVAILISSPILFAIPILIFTKKYDLPNTLLAGFGLILVSILIIMILRYALAIKYICIKCGNSHISINNVLSYPEKDLVY